MWLTYSAYSYSLIIAFRKHCSTTSSIVSTPKSMGLPLILILRLMKLVLSAFWAMSSPCKAAYEEGKYLLDFFDRGGSGAGGESFYSLTESRIYLCIVS
jgi:hypothetical protein